MDFNILSSQFIPVRLHVFSNEWNIYSEVTLSCRSSNSTTHCEGLNGCFSIDFLGNNEEVISQRWIAWGGQIIRSAVLQCYILWIWEKLRSINYSVYKDKCSEKYGGFRFLSSLISVFLLHNKQSGTRHRHTQQNGDLANDISYHQHKWVNSGIVPLTRCDRKGPRLFLLSANAPQ